MEVVGGVGALVALTVEAQRTYKRLKRCVRSLKHAVESVTTVEREVKVFSQLLCRFRHVVEKTQGENELTDRVENSLVQDIVNLGRVALRRIRILLEKVADLRADKNVSRVAHLYARFKWTIQEESVEPIQMSLRNVATYANTFMHTLTLQALFQAGRTMIQHGLHLPNDIKHQIEIYREDIKSLKSERRELQKQCLKLRAKFSDLAEMNLNLLSKATEVHRDHMEAHPELRNILNSEGSVRTDSFAAQTSSFGSPPDSSPAFPTTTTTTTNTPSSSSLTTPPTTNDSRAAAAAALRASPWRPARGVATPLFGGPQRNAQKSTEGEDDESFEIRCVQSVDLSDDAEQTIVIVDQDCQCREEYRRPRSSRVD